LGDAAIIVRELLSDTVFRKVSGTNMYNTATTASSLSQRVTPAKKTSSPLLGASSLKMFTPVDTEAKNKAETYVPSSSVALAVSSFNQDMQKVSTRSSKRKSDTEKDVTGKKHQLSQSFPELELLLQATQSSAATAATAATTATVAQSPSLTTQQAAEFLTFVGQFSEESTSAPSSTTSSSSSSSSVALLPTPKTTCSVTEVEEALERVRTTFLVGHNKVTSLTTAFESQVHASDKKLGPEGAELLNGTDILITELMTQSCRNILRINHITRFAHKVKRWGDHFQHIITVPQQVLFMSCLF